MGRFLAGAGDRLAGIGEHHYRRLLRLRPRPGVTECKWVEGGAALRRATVKVGDKTRTVVLGNEVAYGRREVIALRDLQAVRNMVADYRRALCWLHRVVGTGRALQHVLDVEGRLREFSYVVVIRADAHEEGVGADRRCRALGQRAHEHAVVVGAGRLILESPQEWVVRLCEFHELYACRDAKHEREDDKSANRDDRRAEPV